MSALPNEIAAAQRPFRLAIVGAGLITQGSHLPAALASPLVEVTVIVDPVIGRARDLAQSYGISPGIASSLDNVIGEIDGALIATPNNTHRALAVACLSKGVPVLIEKPLAGTCEEGLDIVRAAEAGGCVVAVGYSTRFRDEVLLLKELLDEGYFGKMRGFVHQFGTLGGWAPLSAYNLDRKTAGGGVLVVSGSHFLDRMLYFWGYPRQAVLEDDSLGGPEASCTARFSYDGFEGVARYSKTAHLANGLVIETDRGYVILRDSDDAEILFRPHGKRETEQAIRRSPPASRVRSSSQMQIEDFVAAIRGGRPPRVDGRQGLESVRLIEQLYANRRTVDVDWYESAEQRVTA